MNSEGKKAWDISQGQTQVNNREIKLMLHSAGASSGLSLSTVTQSDDNNIDEFYNLIGEDVKLLEYIDELPFVNTPLHIAASYGNIQFALEMMSLKPSFVRKLYPNGFSPIHLALQNGHIELVRRLLQLDGDLVLVKGREWLTPLHYIVESGEHLNLLEEFLLLCPDSITDVTAVRHFLSWGSRFMDVNYWRKRFLNVNNKNLEDKTAWDMLQEDNREIMVMLSRTGAKPGSSLSTSNSGMAQYTSGGCSAACNTQLSSGTHSSWWSLAR
nr:ankyrin repeat-containing protein bda1 [Quercus suber]